ARDVTVTVSASPPTRVSTFMPGGNMMYARPLSTMKLSRILTSMPMMVALTAAPARPPTCFYLLCGPYHVDAPSYIGVADEAWLARQGARAGPARGQGGRGSP